MTTQRTPPLPIPVPEYDYSNEALFRRTLEFTFEIIENDIEVSKTKTEKDASLAMRRFQFLLMGAS